MAKPPVFQGKRGTPLQSSPCASRRSSACEAVHYASRAVPFIPGGGWRCAHCLRCGRALLLGAELLWRRGRPDVLKVSCILADESTSLASHCPRTARGVRVVSCGTNSLRIHEYTGYTRTFRTSNPPQPWCSVLFLDPVLRSYGIEFRLLLFGVQLLLQLGRLHRIEPSA